MESWRRVGCEWDLEKVVEVEMSRNTRFGRTAAPRAADALKCYMTRNFVLFLFQGFQKSSREADERSFVKPHLLFHDGGPNRCLCPVFFISGSVCLRPLQEVLSRK